MRDSNPKLVPFDAEEFASSPLLEADDETGEHGDASALDIHERPTLIP
jgi:hypothetical protein